MSKSGRPDRLAVRDPHASTRTLGLEELDEAALVALCVRRRSRDDRPFAELFRRHRSYVFQIAVRWLGDPQEAEDLTQETFFSAYRHLGDFEGRSALRTWLHRIAVNRCKNELRRRASRPVLTAVELDAHPDDSACEERARRDEAAMRTADLARALVLLQPREREILRLAELEERPFAEVARGLGISTSAAKMRAHRARGALRTALQRVARKGGGP